MSKVRIKSGWLGDEVGIWVSYDDYKQLEAQLDKYKDFAERVCRGDIGNTIMFEKLVMKALEKDDG